MSYGHCYNWGDQTSVSSCGGACSELLDRPYLPSLKPIRGITIGMEEDATDYGLAFTDVHDLLPPIGD